MAGSGPKNQIFQHKFAQFLKKNASLEKLEKVTQLSGMKKEMSSKRDVLS